ncbi:CotH kinase family protein [Gordonia sp. NPDC003422]
MSAEEQQKLDSLYALDNVVTVKITMPPADWEFVRNEQPKGGRCNFDWTKGARYTWRRASSVEISGTSFPPKTTFTDVGIKKKSFCGSIRSDKPCLHIDFAKDNEANKPLITGLIGSRYLTLNNSIQDPSFARQVVGYKLFELAGLPYSRCNIVRVLVNGKPIGQGIPTAPAPGVFVSVEPVMPRYIERNFAHRDGNLYEIEHTDDFIDKRFDFIGVEDLSEFDDKADLRLAINHLKAHGIAGAADVFDLDRFIRLYAMDFFLKHWDGYSRNTNNTYVYNDVDAVAAPGLDNVHFTLIPWGLDQILQPKRHFFMGNDGMLADMVRKDPTRHAQLLDQIRELRQSVFDRDVQQSVLIPMIEKMQTILTPLGVPNLPTELGTVRKQLRLALSAGYLAGGLTSSDAVYIRDDATNDCLHASTEAIPPESINFEVTHRPRPADIQDSDLWTATDVGSGKSLTNKASGRNLHASKGLVTSKGHKMLYTGPGDNTDHAEEFAVTAVDADEPFSQSGYFELSSIRTGLKVKFGADASPKGARRVHQDSVASKLFFS